MVYSKTVEDRGPFYLFNGYNKDARVVNYWEVYGDKSGWKVPVRRHLNDWEINKMTSLLG